MTTPAEPMGRFDHIGIAVHSIEAALPFFEEVLGASLRYVREDRSGTFRVAVLDLEGFCIELLDPIDPEGFVARFLARHGEGVHHLTLQVPDLERKVAALEAKGIRVVDKHLDEPGFRDAFISPKSAHGLLIQLGETMGPLNNPPWWEATDEAD